MRPHIGPSAILGQIVGHRRVADVMVAGQVPTVPAADMPLHTHTEAHFIVVTQGDYRSTARGFTGALPSLVFNPPGTEHRDCFAATQRLADAHFYAVWIGPQRWSALCAGLSPPAQACATAGAHVDAITRLIADWLAHGAGDSDELLLELLAAVDETGSADAGERWVAQARERLDQQLDRAPGIASLAAEFGRHPVYFARAFRAATGLAPTDYHLRRRLAQVAARLAAGEASIAAIASDAGFADQAHLSRHFSAVYGIAPARYRDSLARATA